MPPALQRWRRLLQYYYRCLREEQASAAAFSPSDLGVRFVPVAAAVDLLFDRQRCRLPADPRLHAFLGAAAGAGDTVYYGYPLVVRAGSTTRLAPLLYVRLGLTREGSDLWAEALDPLPQVNQAALSPSDVTAEQAAGALPPEAEGPVSPDAAGRPAPFDRLPARLAAWVAPLAELASLPALETLDPGSVPGWSDPAPGTGDGMANRPVLFRAPDGRSLWGLVADLRDLGQPDVWRRSGAGPLGAMLAEAWAEPLPPDGGSERAAGAGTGRQSPPAAPRLVVPSNAAQDRAILRALRERLTVVTGPPGTGKSQLVLNLLASALAAGQSVLFASKNNQAVDVVWRRWAELAASHQVPILVRTGHREHHARALETLRREVTESAAAGRWLPDYLRWAVEQYVVSQTAAESEPALEGAGGSRRARQRLSEQRHLFPQVLRAFPAWAVTNLSVRRAIPMLPGAFDLAIIDEAAQCDVPSALPILARARRAVVIGDPHQLAHVSTLSPQAEAEAAQGSGLGGDVAEAWSYRRRSLYDVAIRALPAGEEPLFLEEHYRSHGDIIGLANRLFYRGRLVVRTDPRTLVRPAGASAALAELGIDRAIRWVQVTGRAVRPAGGSAYNRDEAVGVAELVRELVAADWQPCRPTVGVVTPFRKQRDLIHRLLVDSLPATVLDAHRVSVDTAHGFQGDERDVMVFSPVVSKDCPASTLRFLQETPNLLNVAMTRARSLLFIVGDREACRSFLPV